jgi:hypothetical protein
VYAARIVGKLRFLVHLRVSVVLPQHDVYA